MLRLHFPMKHHEPNTRNETKDYRLHQNQIPAMGLDPNFGVDIITNRIENARDYKTDRVYNDEVFFLDVKLYHRHQGYEERFPPEPVYEPPTQHYQVTVLPNSYTK
jgi:hypothetical protein